ncbi:MAG TPA: hypothetical protein PKY82_26280 [Pyrinomonadaceae bacterium]|nr:hypothetical protein [Pyrinomonadaceae bacterium]
MKRQTNQRPQFLMLTVIATFFLLGAFNSTFAQPGSGAKYGSRDLTTCDDTKAPTKGAITVALAAQYARCTYEKADGNSIGLLEDLKIQVGGAVPFSRKTYPYASDVEPTTLVYPLRGSYKNYLCDAISDASENRGANCTVFVNTKAEGVCWKTTFGDWWCAITNGGGANESGLTEYKMPPPSGAKTTATKDKPADKQICQKPKIKQLPLTVKMKTVFQNPIFQRWRNGSKLPASNIPHLQNAI